MNYQEAIRLQSDYQFLIGSKGKYVDYYISNIFVLPYGNEKVVLEKILTSADLSPKQIVESHDAKEYAVVVVFEIDGNYTFQDISLYIDQRKKRMGSE